MLRNDDAELALEHRIIGRRVDEFPRPCAPDEGGHRDVGLSELRPDEEREVVPPLMRELLLVPQEEVAHLIFLVPQSADVLGRGDGEAKPRGGVGVRGGASAHDFLLNGKWNLLRLVSARLRNLAY